MCMTTRIVWTDIYEKFVWVPCMDLKLIRRVETCVFIHNRMIGRGRSSIATRAVAHERRVAVHRGKQQHTGESNGFRCGRSSF